jgi:ubiquinone/menaquinone biosynthesis C-methylase UbiE
MTGDRDYVLGTHDQEIARLGLQHRARREDAIEAWRIAGFGQGHTVLDAGCGPGYASMELAEVVGPAGRVIAVPSGRHFWSLKNCLAVA